MLGFIVMTICWSIPATILMWLDAPTWTTFAVLGAMLGVRLLGYTEGEKDGLKVGEQRGYDEAVMMFKTWEISSK